MSETLEEYAFVTESPDGPDVPKLWVVPLEIVQCKLASLKAENERLRIQLDYVEGTLTDEQYHSAMGALKERE
jgi:hypothetical protein